MEYISYNMGTRDFPDIYVRALGPAALGIYIRQIPLAHVIAFIAFKVLRIRLLHYRNDWTTCNHYGKQYLT